jgi:hypothetical protein
MGKVGLVDVTKTASCKKHLHCYPVRCRILVLQLEILENVPPNYQIFKRQSHFVRGGVEHDFKRIKSSLHSAFLQVQMSTSRCRSVFEYMAQKKVEKSTYDDCDINVHFVFD